ncbi:hypothetical protein M948_18230 [Virgibacillus sp. CM-4]|nr:hypothetical protein M948_18230 [Virgibacillus sp. CM-4]
MGVSDTNSFNDTELTADTEYVYQIKAIGSDGKESILSAELTISTVPAV